MNKSKKILSVTLIASLSFPVVMSHSSELLKTGLTITNQIFTTKTNLILKPIDGCYDDGFGIVECDPNQQVAPTNNEQGGDGGGQQIDITPQENPQILPTPPIQFPKKKDIPKRKRKLLPNPPSTFAPLYDRIMYWSKALQGEGQSFWDINYLLFVSPGSFNGSLKTYSDSFKNEKPKKKNTKPKKDKQRGKNA